MKWEPIDVIVLVAVIGFWGMCWIGIAAPAVVAVAGLCADQPSVVGLEASP